MTTPPIIAINATNQRKGRRSSDLVVHAPRIAKIGTTPTSESAIKAMGGKFRYPQMKIDKAITIGITLTIGARKP